VSQASTGTTLGIDFGTSNSAAAWRAGNGPAQALRLEGDNFALPTALFFNAEDRRVHFGRDAVAQYLTGADGRLMRSLKSLLGSALLLEKTEVNGQAMSFQDIIGIFLKEIVARARQQTGADPDRVVLGRPVHFVDDDPERDALAQQMLLQAAHAVGLRNVGFQLEPIAAAFDYEQRITRDSRRAGGRHRRRHLRLHRGAAGAGPRTTCRRPCAGHPGHTRRAHGRHRLRPEAQPGARHAAAGLSPHRPRPARGAQRRVL
jgi:molecular chaperone DnaK (HSP70)